MVGGLRMLVLAIPVVAYAIVLMIIDTTRSSVYWWSLAFLLFSYLMLGISSVVVPRSRISGILAMPLIVVAGVYLAVQFLLANVFMFVPGVSLTVAMALQIVLGAAFLVVFFFTMSSNETVAAKIEEHYADVQVIHRSVARIVAMKRMINDPKLRKAIEKLEEEFRYSPTARVRSIHHLDDQIDALLVRLEYHISTNAQSAETEWLIAQISSTLAERNAEIRIQQ